MSPSMGQEFRFRSQLDSYFIAISIARGLQIWYKSPRKSRYIAFVYALKKKKFVRYCHVGSLDKISYILILVKCHWYESTLNAIFTRKVKRDKIIRFSRWSPLLSDVWALLIGLTKEGYYVTHTKFTLSLTWELSYKYERFINGILKHPHMK